MLQALGAESQYSMILTCTDFASFAETQRDLNLSQQCGPARRVKEMTRIQVGYECGPADQSCTSAVDEKRLIWIQWVEFHKALSVVFLLGKQFGRFCMPKLACKRNPSTPEPSQWSMLTWNVVYWLVLHLIPDSTRNRYSLRLELKMHTLVRHWNLLVCLWQRAVWTPQMMRTYSWELLAKSSR